ncbi:MAG TPA: DUF2007 domain-containing protein [Pirellulales bacterium]|jgi:hypothetical protein
MTEKSEDDRRQVVVFSDARPALVNLVYNRLAEAGIEAFVDNAFLGQAAGDLPAGAIMPRVIVAEVDAEQARQVVAEFRGESRAALVIAAARSAGAAIATTPAADDEAEFAGREIELCPACGRGRMTICPYCNTASDAFPAADDPVPRGAQGEAALVICQTCDEPFTPIYYRRCAWCGHDFGAGRENEPPESVEYLNDRVTIAMLGLGLVLLAILAYFSSLTK